MFHKYTFKLVGALGTILQYGCVTHCALEYIGDFVVSTTFRLRIEQRNTRVEYASRIVVPNIEYQLQLEYDRGTKIATSRRIQPCTGPSMEPTIYSNDVLFTEHISPRLQRMSKGDIIIAKCPSNPQQHICKRITGLPGDKVRHGYTTYTVPLGHIWLEGDNNSNSADSRIYGPVPQGLVRGRAVCKVWPLHDITMFTTKYVQQE